jgi:hypothetical protein
MAMLIKPSSKAFALFRWKCFDGGFQLFHAHTGNLQFPE